MQPSRRARIASRLVRMVVKRWPRNNLAATVRRSRWLFGSPGIFSFLQTSGVQITSVNEAAVRGEWLALRSCSQEKVLLYLHGGGYVSCSPASHRPITARLARMLGWRIFALDYRLAPEHPFPAAVDDAMYAYDWLAKSGMRAENITLAGDSAGGGLVVALLLRLRERQRPLPARAVCFSPWVDLTGDCNYRNADSCAMFRGADVSSFASLYLGTAAATAPEASPIFADLAGIPPLLIQVSSTELLLDDAVRLHERALGAGVQSTLSIYPGVPHVWQIFPGLIPEARLALLEAAEFLSAGKNAPAFSAIP
jgi:epsilon-lactone hydrolase